MSAPAHGRTVVVGLGRSGLSVLAHLSAHGFALAAVDSRREPPGLTEARHRFPDLELHLGGFHPAYLRGAALLVLSPGVARDEPAIAAALAHGVPACGDVELFARVARRPVAAITGSNGKSTVTTLVGEMARADGRAAAVGGNLGLPALDLLPPPPWAAGGGAAEADLYVLELSSFQLETTASLAPRVAACLNVSPDHMDRYPSVEAYAAAKRRVFRRARTAVVNRDDPWVARMAAELAAEGMEVVAVTAGEPGPGEYGLASAGGRTWLALGGPDGGERLLEAQRVALLGRHNLINALTALAIASAMGIARAPALEALARFDGLPHRCQPVAGPAGVRWVDDSKGTNVGATLAALEGLGGLGPIVLIAGGDGKGADFSPLAGGLRGRARAVVLIGRDGPRLGAAVGDAAPCHSAQDMSEAVRIAAGLARPGDVVLLSPACASWDMYPDYAARGRDFASAVQALAAPGQDA